MTAPEWAEILVASATGIGGLIGWSLWLAWWVSKQFSSQKGLFFDRIEMMEDNILKKLEYHERHDDKRFADVRDDVYQINLRNAAKDGMNFRIRERKIFDPEETGYISRETISEIAS